MPLKRTRLLLLVAMAAGTAHADDKAACVAAYSSAQDLRAAGKLVEARGQLVVCAPSTCPDFIARDCSQWLGEVETSTPTIVVSAKDDAGTDVGDVTVTVDGKPFLDRLDGRAVPMDPGSHTFTYRHGDYPPVTDHVLVTMGEKNRELDVVFSKPKPHVAPPPPPVIVAKPPPRPEPPRTLRTLGFVGLGVGGAALVSGAVLGIVAFATKGAHCTNDVCDPGTVSTLDGEATASTIALIGGAVLAAAGVTLLILQPRHSKTALVVMPPLIRATF
jgi:hypothetical protein